MKQLPVIFKRELASYFATPLAYVFILIFLVLSGVFTFYLGGFFERNQADLQPFFNFHPWLYLFLVPASPLARAMLVASSLATLIIELSADGVVDFSGTYDDYLRSQGVLV